MPACMLPGLRLKAAFHYSSKLQTWLQRVFDLRERVESTSQAGRKHVANPHELVENLAANLVENQVCSSLE